MMISSTSSGSTITLTPLPVGIGSSDVDNNHSIVKRGDGNQIWSIHFVTIATHLIGVEDSRARIGRPFVGEFVSYGIGRENRLRRRAFS